MTTKTTEAERLLDLCLMTAYAARSAAAAQRAPCYEALLAELRRLAAVEAERDELKRGLALVQQHHATAWNRGHEAGMRANRDIARQATDAVKRDAWGNSQLTEALMAAETERDQLRAEMEALRRGECICKRCGLRQPGESAGPVPF